MGARRIGGGRGFVSSVGARETNLISRYYSNVLLNNSSLIVPSSAAFADIRCLGFGGESTYENTAWFRCGGGGGAFARSLVAVTPGETLSLFNGSYNSVRATEVRRGGTTLTLAAFGQNGQALSPTEFQRGFGGQASACIGDVVRSGGDGSVFSVDSLSTVYTSTAGSGGGGSGIGGNGEGGNSAGDFTDPDTLYLWGAATGDRFSEVGIGAGAHGSKPPSIGVWTPKPGALWIEFYDGAPR